MGWKPNGGSGGGAGTGWDGSVADFASLPAATGSGQVYLVLASTGFLWNRRKGLYRDSGTWNRLSNTTFEVLDTESTMSDDADNTKKMNFELSSITTGNTRTLTIPDNSGVVAVDGLANDFTFNGAFNTTGTVVHNEAGADVDFRVEGVGQANALYVQGSDGFVGIHKNAPAVELDVTGSINNAGHVKSSNDILTDGTVDNEVHYQIATSVTSDTAGTSRYPRAMVANLTTAGAVDFGVNSQVQGLQGQVTLEADVDVATAQGLFGRVQVANSNSTTTNAVGMEGELQVAAASDTITLTNAICLKGKFRGRTTNTTDLTNLSVIQAELRVDSGRTITTTDTAYFQGSDNIQGTLNADNLYGLLLPDITDGTANYAIKTGAGIVSFVQYIVRKPFPSFAHQDLPPFLLPCLDLP